MTIGISHNKYISMYFEAAAKLEQQKGDFAAEMTAANSAKERGTIVLGMAFFDVGGNQSLGIKEVASSFGSWYVLKNNGRNAEMLGQFAMADSVEEFTTVRQDWNAMLSSMKENHMEAGVFKQALDADKLLVMFKEYMDDLYERIQSGNITTPSYQI